jgi:stage II sporulation protein AA (anti-sigma F factor antagonist)
MQTGVHVAVTVAGAAVIVITLIGDLDISTAMALKTRVARVGGDEAGRRILIDMSDLDFCDAYGLGVLLGVRNRCAERRGWLRLAGAKRQIRRLLDITDLTEVLPCYSSVEQALADDDVPTESVIYLSARRR